MRPGLMERAVGAPGSRPRMGALDALRGLALVAVLGYHVAPSAVPGGFLGVEVFFVLSGFLLASLLLDEHRRAGRIDALDYGRRRVRRLAPAGLVLLACIVVVGPVVAPDDAHRILGDVRSSLVGLTNWHLIVDGSSYFDQLGRPSFVRHLWSLAVEIQFYLVCPFLLMWLAACRRWVGMAVLATGISASSLLMALLYRADDPSRAYYGTEARVGALLTGVLLALVVADTAARTRRRRSPPWVVPGAAGVAAATLVALTLLVDERSRALYPLGFLVTQSATVVLILASRHPGPVAALLDRPSLRWLGRRSYGIYLWHWPLVVLLRPGIDVSWSLWQAALTTTGLAVLLGALSYSMLEAPFIDQRSRVLPAGRGRAVGATAVAVLVVGTISLAVLRTPVEDPIAASIRAGEQLLAQQPAVTVPPSTSPPAAEVAEPPPSEVTESELVPVLEAVAAPDPAAPPTPTTTPTPPGTAPPPSPPPPPASPPPSPPPPGPPPGSVSVTAIGDSVMIGAARELQARLGSSGFIDARQSRQFAEGIEVARRLREEGRLGRVVIVHLGHNGPVRPHQVDALMVELAGVEQVLLVNVRVNRSWEGESNASLHDGAERHPTAHLVDWHGHSAGQRSWFQSDGTHLRPAGSEAYASLLVGSIRPDPPPTTTTTEPPAPTTTTTEPTPTNEPEPVLPLP